MGDYSLGEPVANRLEFDDTFKAAKRLFHQVLVKVKMHQLLLGERTRGENARVAVKFLGVSQDLGPDFASFVEVFLQPGFDGFASAQQGLRVTASAFRTALCGWNGGVSAGIELFANATQRV